MTTIAFLHIPKTAGQTIHNELARIIGKDQVSPIRVHSQVSANRAQMPAGYHLYSGHIDWVELETLPTARFVFTVLRDPKERIGSFYLYLRKKAQGMSKEHLARPENTGLRQISRLSADDYFFQADPAWQAFIHDHYDNFYCSYLATQRMRGWPLIAGLGRKELVAQALANAAQIDRIYPLDGLVHLEEDIERLTGFRIRVDNNFHNSGELPRQDSRWCKLQSCFESDASVRHLEKFVAADEVLMQRLGFS